jgi:hypothetical protein
VSVSAALDTLRRQAEDPRAVAAGKATAAWSDRLVREARLRYGEPPQYGSPAFLALDQDDPLRLAALVVAAEAWRREHTPEVFAQRLADELVARQQVDGAARDEIAHWVVGRVRSMGNPHSVWYPTQADLVRRRQEVVYR